MKKLSAYTSLEDVQVGDRVLQFISDETHQCYEGLGTVKEIEHDSMTSSRVIVFWEKERENRFCGHHYYWDLTKVGHISKLKDVRTYKKIDDVKVGDRVKSLIDWGEPETIPIEGTVCEICQDKTYVRVRWDRSHDELEEHVIYWELVKVAKRKSVK